MTKIEKYEKYRPIIDAVERIKKLFPSENGIEITEQFNMIGMLDHKGEWHCLEGYNYLAQLSIVTKALEPLLA